MTERRFIRKLESGLWQWRTQGQDGKWLDDLQVGDEDTFNARPLSEMPACLIMPGEQAVVRRVPVDKSEKKHLAKLLPYELEEQLVDAVEDLHFCFGRMHEDEVDLVYIDADMLSLALDQVLVNGDDVQQIFADFTLLDLDEADGILVLEEERVLAHFRNGRGFVIEINIAPLVIADDLEQLLQDAVEGIPLRLRLVADTVEGLETLKSCLPETSLVENGVSIDEQLGGFWDVLDAQIILQQGALNMRTGAFGRQLPFTRWWQLWKTPTYAAAAAFVFAVVVTFGDYLTAKSEGKAIRQQIEQVYLQAVPNGRRGDEENRLRSLLRAQGGASAGQPTNLVFLLSGLAKTMAAQNDIQLSNFRYNGDQRELQINIEVKGLGELGQFREMLESNGLESDSPRTSSQGDIYRATMKLTEKS